MSPEDHFVQSVTAIWKSLKRNLSPPEQQLRSSLRSIVAEVRESGLTASHLDAVEEVTGTRPAA